MTIVELGYLLVGAPDVEAWRDFGSEIVGAMPVEGPDGALYLKIDRRAFRIAVVPGRSNGLIASGWLVADLADFEAMRAALTADGVALDAGDVAGRALRKVQDYVGFVDPAGHRHEIAWGPVSDYAPFVSPAGVSGFVTDGLGLGHVVLATGNRQAEATAFWSRPGRFALSDILHIPWGDGGTASIHFFHCANGRQHSLALGGIEVPGGCIHVMLEAASLDDVGRALDRVRARNIALTATLGRHVNDEMLSFYMLTPAGFSLEFGTGGKVVDWDRHIVFETTRGSHWGHEYLAAGAGEGD